MHNAMYTDICNNYYTKVTERIFIQTCKYSHFFKAIHGASLTLRKISFHQLILVCKSLF